MAPSGRYHHGNLREGLVSAALCLVRTEGLAAVTTRACADHNRVASSAVFRHFRNRRSLLTAVAAEGFRHLAARMEAAERSADGDTRLLAIGHAYLGFAREEPHLFRLMYSGAELDLSDPDLMSTSDPLMSQTAAAIGADVAPDDPRALLAWAIVHGLATLLLDSQLKGLVPDAPEARALVLDSVLRRALPVFGPATVPED